MMGQAEPQKQIFHTVQIEQLVPADHPLRRIRPLVDAQRIRELCKKWAEPLQVDRFVNNMGWCPGSEGATSHANEATIQSRPEEARC